MAAKILNSLEEQLLDCRLTLFGGKNLDSFINAVKIKEYLAKSSNIKYFDFRFLNDKKSLAEIGFYTSQSKYELSDTLKNLSIEQGFGLAYSIKAIGSLL
ncbi:MAG: hypothetical protein QXL94_01245 [Candidatus Parvarchaeum sp.]